MFNGINSPIFSWRQFLIESGVKAFISINTERLIVKIEETFNAIPNVPLGSYYRHGLSGITSGRRTRRDVAINRGWLGLLVNAASAAEKSFPLLTKPKLHRNNK